MWFELLLPVGINPLLKCEFVVAAYMLEYLVKLLVIADDRIVHADTFI
jgi:hypothetical protein